MFFQGAPARPLHITASVRTMVAAAGITSLLAGAIGNIYFMLEAPRNATKLARTISVATEELITISEVSLEEINRRLLDVSTQELLGSADLHQTLNRFDRYLPPGAIIVIADSSGSIQWTSRPLPAPALYKQLIPETNNDNSSTPGDSISTFKSPGTSSLSYLVVTRPRTRITTLVGWLSLYVPLSNLQQFASVTAGPTPYQLLLSTGDQGRPFVLAGDQGASMVPNSEPVGTPLQGRGFGNDVYYEQIGSHDAFIGVRATHQFWTSTVPHVACISGLAALSIAVFLLILQGMRPGVGNASLDANTPVGPTSQEKAPNLTLDEVHCTVRVFSILQSDLHRKINTILADEFGETKLSAEQKHTIANLLSYVDTPPDAFSIDHTMAKNIPLSLYLPLLAELLEKLFKRDIRASVGADHFTLYVTANSATLTLIIMSLAHALLRQNASRSISLSATFKPTPFYPNALNDPADQVVISIGCTDAVPTRLSPFDNITNAASFDLAGRLARIAAFQLSSETDPKGGLTYHLSLPVR
ncbi:hypothetical protein [Nitrospirillum amazonense]|uniref:hypothetical protein n=1 Tax=Nitrospirillum amazonense TaxID=28077 RepID=UPI002412432D|nr:hypothetical protein [Nitrospirillum amazonense]MDG3444566.1 hypothetical protein [Nitrospirillum amazonense]